MTVASSTAVGAKSPSKALHIGLWVVQVVLGLMFGAGGIMKATQPISELVAQMVWASAVPEVLVRFIGVSELLGGIGLILPAATRIKPQLTPLAGVGLALIMLLAALFHLVRSEFGAIGVNVVLGGLAAFVAWGRAKKAPIPSR
jgi:putative oxidoreductase